MRISKEQARTNRQRVIDAASELFRARGFEAVPVSELMQAAGFTHGGFYNHFPSKEGLAAEALASAWAQVALERQRAGSLPHFLRRYLSHGARKAPGQTCPAAALAGDVARQSDEVKDVFASGLDDMIESLAVSLGRTNKMTARDRAIDLVTRMVGALMLSRAVPDEHPLADEILRVALKAAQREARQ